MTQEPVIAVRGLSRTFGGVPAVEDVSFDVGAGRIVGLVGRNGAGKTTTLRMLLGLTSPTAGTATILGHSYPSLPHASHLVGVSMGGLGALPGITGRRDLEIWARTLGLPKSRIDEVLDLVGLHGIGAKRLGDFSTGMVQRHNLAVALLADPQVLILDEATTGLDPDGIRWLRDTLRSLAADGHTVLLSSHLLAEVELTVDDVLVLQGSLRFAGTLEEFTRNGTVRLEDRFFETVGAREGASDRLVSGDVAR